MNSEAALFAFTTSNYDTMLQFFRAIGLQVDEEHTQLCPLFNSGRGAYISRGEVGFNLEESTSGPASAAFNLWFSDAFTAEDVDKWHRNGTSFTTETSLFGTFHTFKSPDGGSIVISA